MNVKVLNERKIGTITPFLIEYGAFAYPSVVPDLFQYLISSQYPNLRTVMVSETPLTVPCHGYLKERKVMCSTCAARATHRVEEDVGMVVIRTYYCKSCFDQLDQNESGPLSLREKCRK